MARFAGRSFSGAAAFWDASALVSLCVRESGSAEARSYFRRFDQVVWWASLVEVHRAISRLRRNGNLTEDGRDRALSRLQSLHDACREILPDEAVRNLACELLEKYSLKAPDSLQLAASLVWCGGRPSRRTFICGDRRLASAAASAGFTVLDVS